MLLPNQNAMYAARDAFQKGAYAQVLENLRLLDGLGIPTIIRTPVIPGFNDSEDNIRATAEFLKTLKNLRYYELLSYNPMGNDKRRRLGYPVPEIEIPKKETMHHLASIARQAEIPLWVDGKESR